MKTVVTALALASLGGAISWAASPPIVNPGAPGAPSRMISAEESLALSATQHTEADVQFMQHMIVHHNQAVQMGSLIEERTDNRSVGLIGQRISLSQQSEMDMMTTWLMVRGEEVADEHLGHNMHAMHADDSGHGDHSAHADHVNHSMHADHSEHADHSSHEGHDMADMDEVDPREIPLMPGMLSEAQMERLEAAEGAEFDRLFLEGMIVHHQGAIDMVESLMSNPGSGEDPQLSEFLSHVVADQSAEILRMRNLLSAMDEEHAHAGHH
ncbi:DUF305 domain-containing protein [Maricaulaceae bacterium NA33B04]|nr:DUF305 domain-containing protein [Maricaulaceae bacterium NA33B04]